MNPKYSWIFVALMVLVSGLWLDVRHSYAQDDEVMVKEVFTIRNRAAGINAATHNGDFCEVTVELRWYKKKKVKVMYHWQACSDAYTVRWALASIRNPSGDFTFTAETGTTTVYYESWPELKTGDSITLHTWINDVQQADVTSRFEDTSPIWAQIHTRQDEGGACFQFTGHVDPWGVFTAGDKSYVLELNTQDWVTPWLVGPNQSTVDWHVQFYQDAQLTQLRNEYWFNNVANPCYKSDPPSCDSVTLTIPTGSLIPAAGAEVAVTIVGHHGSQYRIVDQDGQVVAGPSTAPQLPLHALPRLVYQGQVYSETHGWTTAGCQFQYGENPPACTGVVLNPTRDTRLLPTGQSVAVTINASNASQYRIVDGSGQVVAGPSATPIITFHALPSVPYQAQVYSATYGWTTSGCQFQYQPIEPPTCEGVTVNPTTDIPLPPEGKSVQVTVNGKNATQYRIVDTTDGTVVAGPSAANVFSLHARPEITYQAQIYNESYGWTNNGCTFKYITVAQINCTRVELSIANGAIIEDSGATVQAIVKATGVTEYRIVQLADALQAETVVAGPSTGPEFTLHVIPNVRYQGQVLNEAGKWVGVGCEFGYQAPPTPVFCEQIELSIPNGARIPKDGTDVEVSITGLNATQYRVVEPTGNTVVGPTSDALLRFHALPDILYQAQVADAQNEWTTIGCQFSYGVDEATVPTCTGVALSIPDRAVIPASGTAVDVTIQSQNASLYQIVDAQGARMAGPGTAANLHIHAMPNVHYQAQVAAADGRWTTTGCDFTYTLKAAMQAFCELRASHYGDPGGRSEIKAWVAGETTPVAIERIKINWDGVGSVTYPTKRQSGPWVTNTRFELVSRPEVHDVGFGYYKFEAWVYITGIATPAYCWDDGHAPDHDNLAPDPGPFAQANAEGKLNRGNTPSRLPTVGRLPFDGGNGPDKVELILWAFEKEGRGVNARITAIANEGKPLARLGMASVSNSVKFDGLSAREGIVYGFQIGEHGPWSPLFCPKADGNPTTITIYWAAGGMTWLSDGAAYGDCWWLTVAAALQGWVTVDESVATYNALQPIINWNGHRNLRFSLAQSGETGLGPRMQDAVIGLQAREWQGPIVPMALPADFAPTVEAYQAIQAK